MGKRSFLLILSICLMVSGCARHRGETAIEGAFQPTQTTEAENIMGDNSTLEETNSAEDEKIVLEPGVGETVNPHPQRDAVDTAPSSAATGPDTKLSEPPKATESTMTIAAPTTEPVVATEAPTIPAATDPSAPSQTRQSTTPVTSPTAAPAISTETTAAPTEDVVFPGQETAASMTQQTYNGLKYWLYTPANPVANLPLIVYLHGGSGKGDDLKLLTDADGFPQYVKDGRICCNAYIIFPQCPSGQKGWKTMGGKVEALIHYTCSTYDLNINKVSLTGHSMGGTGTWTLALDKPELFCKIAPMSGSVTINDRALAKLSAIPVWAVVGDKDKLVAPDTSIAMIDALKQNGANAKITILEGADHFDVPGLGYLGTDVIDWLIA